MSDCVINTVDYCLKFQLLHGNTNCSNLLHLYFLSKMKPLVLYNKLQVAISTGSEGDVWRLLYGEHIDDLHGYMCTELPKRPAVCSRCETLLKESLAQQHTSLIRLLLEHGVYPSDDICTAGYQYNHARSTKLQSAAKSGSLYDVRQLLSLRADDINVHPRFCVRRLNSFRSICRDCDTPLMAAVRREDIAMMRLLIANGARLSEVVQGDYGFGHCGSTCSRKTALLIAVYTENEEVITKLVTSGADVNQSLGPVGTVLHLCYDQDPIVQLLVRLGANPNALNQRSVTVVMAILFRYHFRDCGVSSSALTTLCTVLPATGRLDVLLAAYCRRQESVAPMSNECVSVFLQMGTRITYCSMYLTGSSDWASTLRQESKPHSERFIDLLRAADTDFSGVRQRIASVDKDEWAPLNLTILDQKLSQPLTLQTSCVISVRRQLHSVSELWMWARIEKLPLSPNVKDCLKLILL